MHILKILYRTAKSLLLQFILMVLLLNTVLAQGLPELNASADLLITQKQEKL